MKNIECCLWFDTQAEEAVKFYCSLFKNTKTGKKAYYGPAGAKASGQKEGTLMTLQWELEGLPILAMNCGPQIKITPALSLFVYCHSETEITTLWKSLSQGGEIRMGLDKYPWAEKYGWTRDKYGMEWQLIYHKDQPSAQKVVPAFLFVDSLYGKGKEAINFYVSIFKNSKINNIVYDEKTKSVMHCQFTLAGQTFVLMEGQGTHGYSFNWGFSLLVNCDSQSEIDYYWEKLSKGGKVEQCGWLKDPYGVSWQIDPTILGTLVSNPNRVKADRVFAELMKMKKIDIAALEKAANG